jgi:Kef-type K+ transport system membrane component KefB
MTENDARADLAYIRRLLEDTRHVTCVGGGYFLVWGVVTLLGLLLTWAWLTGAWAWSPLVAWSVCLALGAAGTLFLIRRERHEPAQGLGGKLIGAVWLSLGIAMLIIIFIGVGSGSLDGRHMTALASTLIGGAVFMTGTLAGMPWLRNLSFAWWAGAVVMFAWPGLYVLLLMAIMVLALYVVPGLILIRMRHRQGAAPGR